ncbi:ferredoxin reductase [Streptomyces sp. NPDC005507]|uniref:ferredoxin reductase n=1 Tax=unclassified Streptomyces TaxID=2593676 RepID=UPI0033B43CE5
MIAATARSTAVVEQREDITPNVVLLTLRLPGSALGPVPPGSHVDVTVHPLTGSDTRSYSLVDLGHDDGLLRIAVRRHDEGRGGSAWMHTLKAGDEVQVTGPIDEFGLNPGSVPSVLLAAGIGITPILGLARALRTRGGDYRVLYTGRTRRSMPFTGELEQAHPGRVISRNRRRQGG